MYVICFFFFFQAEDGIRDLTVTGVQTCALPIFAARLRGPGAGALERPDRALPRARSRGEPAHRELHHAGAVLPSAAAPRTARGAATAGPVYSEEPAAPSPSHDPARGADHGDLPAGAGRPRG